MNYTQDEQANTITNSKTYLHFPSLLSGFTNTESVLHTSTSGKKVYRLQGVLRVSDTDRTCPNCGGIMHIHDTFSCSLWHLSFGQNYSCLEFDKKRYLCPECSITSIQKVPFQADGHRITTELLQYTRDLLAIGTYTLTSLPHSAMIDCILFIGLIERVRFLACIALNSGLFARIGIIALNRLSLILLRPRLLIIVFFVFTRTVFSKVQSCKLYYLSRIFEPANVSNLTDYNYS